MLKLIMKNLISFTLAVLILFQTASPVAALSLSPTLVKADPHLAFVPFPPRLLSKLRFLKAFSIKKGKNISHSAKNKLPDNIVTVPRSKPSVPNSSRVDINLLKDTHNSFEFARDIYDAYSVSSFLYNSFMEYKERKAAQGESLSPCESIFISPQGSSQTFELFDSKTCPSLGTN